MSIPHTRFADMKLAINYLVFLTLGAAVFLSFLNSGWCDSWISAILPPR
jgi:hypothetical protein